LPAQWWRWAGWLAAATLAVIVAVAAVSSYAEGNTHHYFGEKRFGTLASVAVLVGSGCVCFKISRRIAPDPFSRFWFWSAILFLFVGLDDLLLIHERLDRAFHAALGWDPDDPVTDHIDDLLLAVYVFPAVWLAWRHRARLLQLVPMIQLMGMAFVCFAGMVYLDFTSRSLFYEETLKLVAGVLIFLGFLTAYYDRNLIAKVSTFEPQRERVGIV